MKRALFVLALLCLPFVTSSAARAASKHPICLDVGPTFGVGVSHFSSSDDWVETARADHGVRCSYLYWYLLATHDPIEDQKSWIQRNLSLSRANGATAVFTFYQLLGLGEDSGFHGSEAEIVGQALGDASVMSA